LTHLSFSQITPLILGFLVLSFTSGIVYILNDIHDLSNDKKHPEKKNRPLTSGRLSLTEVSITAIVLAALISGLLVYLKSAPLVYLVIAMLLLNTFYTNFGKKIPFIEFIVLGVIYTLRALAGFLILIMDVPLFLLIAVFSLSMFMSASRRLVEMTKYGKEARDVLSRYSEGIIKKFIVVMMVLTIVSFYITTAFVTGPILYANGLIIFGMIYFNEIISSKERIKDLSDDISTIILSNKILLILAAVMIIISILNSISW
jgi:4-hydroxybenzoate polyprenyltransferase